MTLKRFIEFATQNTDNGEINNGFHDSKTGEWYYTKDSENAEKICGFLNELHSRNKRLEYKIQRERNSFTKTHERWSKEAETKIKELAEENEQLKQFKEDVFNKIDMHLRMLPTARDNEFNEDDGDPSLYVGAIYMLETLRKELEE